MVAPSSKYNTPLRKRVFPCNSLDRYGSPPPSTEQLLNDVTHSATTAMINHRWKCHGYRGFPYGCLPVALPYSVSRAHTRHISAGRQAGRQTDSHMHKLTHSQPSHMQKNTITHNCTHYMHTEPSRNPQALRYTKTSRHVQRSSQTQVPRHVSTPGII